ncbi:helix-turn-helix domain-containing protein [Fictibacillus sp. 18YEL24]|uniref:helix-turn-helix domain-containing protein n=1 Tax=Fictibacillus sp. 18YEL24 TaxID=2745875 RepID=UPI0018CE74DB|nr:helix-turn-helix transcriptional regulator [Fictibacillus sp. 18YEL24]MBH0171061.1 helix-turn-helix transcriptional regulator [Fictibacillus sp. 18YEL24]
MFGERLRELRKTKTNYTMKEFGKIFNLAESTISGYETGSRKPDMETIQKFADYFEVSIDYMIGRSEDKGKNEAKPDNENLFYFDLEGLSEEDKKEIDKYIELLKLRAKQFNEDSKKNN